MASSTAEANVARMRRWVTEVQQGKRTDLYDEFIAPNFFDNGIDGTKHDRNFGKAMLEKFAQIIDDFKVEIVSCVGQDDMVATNKIFTGTMNEDSPFLGLKKGDQMHVRVMDFVRFKDGMMVEHTAATQPFRSQ